MTMLSKRVKKKLASHRRWRGKHAQPAQVSYQSVGANGFGIKRDVLFCFDLELPESFKPKPIDGEVESFALRPVPEVLRMVAETDEYKDNCNLVLIDFFLRHGYIAADSPGYLDLLTSLRMSDCS